MNTARLSWSRCIRRSGEGRVSGDPASPGGAPCIPLLRHWRLLSVGFLMVAFSAVGQTFVLSLFGGEWRATFGLSHGGLGLVYSTATLLSALLLIAAGHLVDRVALPLMVAGVVLGAALGSVALALSVGVPGLVLGFFLLRFFGQGLMTHTAQT
ncbi:MAG: hypothetical protein VBE63_08740, partial [Lamprobacter sp.]|nr:hypothetical protein [Lamprobacter sp.]